MNTWSIYNPGPDQTDYSVDCAIRFAKLITSAEVQQEMSSGANLDYTTPIIGGQGPSAIPGIGELLDGVEEWFPNVAGVTFVAPEARSVYWDNIVQFASGTLTAEDFAEAMARDWEDVFSRVEID
jgi:ABC-type glycerol-3-phosphate transport system substrate-binding protein